VPAERKLSSSFLMCRRRQEQAIVTASDKGPVAPRPLPFKARLQHIQAIKKWGRPPMKHHADSWVHAIHSLREIGNGRSKEVTIPEVYESDG